MLVLPRLSPQGDGPVVAASVPTGPDQSAQETQTAAQGWTSRRPSGIAAPQRSHTP